MSDFDECAARAWLAGRGLPLYAAFSLARLREPAPEARPQPDPLHQSLRHSLEEADPAGEYASAVLLGNAGPSLWPALQAAGPRGEHPVDDYSRATALAFAARFAGEPRALCLYPGAEQQPPLQLWSQLAGWHQRSPLGMGIHPRHGLWQACRALLLLRSPLPECREPPGVSPCHGCAAPCVAACPAQALAVGEWPDMRRCLDHRVAAASGCADRCLARLACPVAAGQRYPLAQIAHHYRDPADTRRRYLAMVEARG